jgi:hypothetical protein
MHHMFWLVSTEGGPFFAKALRRAGLKLHIFFVYAWKLETKRVFGRKMAFLLGFLKILGLETKGGETIREL